MSPRPKVLASTLIYRGRVLSLVREELQWQGHRLVRETVQHPGAVVVLPVLDDGRLVMVRQYRHAVGRSLLELPAGTLDRRESALACAKRELAEETGWMARRWRRLASFYAAPGCLSERMTLFLAEGLRHVGANPEPGEGVAPVTLTRRQALAKIRTGEICDAKTIIGVLWLGL